MVLLLLQASLLVVVLLLLVSLPVAVVELVMLVPVHGLVQFLCLCCC